MWLLILIVSCTPIEVPEQDISPARVTTTSIEKRVVDNTTTLEITFDIFSIGAPPPATFHSIDFLVSDGQFLYPICQLRMGYNTIYQASADSTKLWIVQDENGYGYVHGYLDLYKLEKFTLIYYDGYCHTLNQGLDNRQRIPHFFGYNPITTIVIEVSEYQ